MDKYNTQLYCIQCDEETEHKVVYIDGKIKMVKCNQCDTTFGVDENKLLESYTKEKVNDILTKPARLKNEIKEEGTKILFSLPKRIITKPYRVIKEVIRLLEE